MQISDLTFLKDPVLTVHLLSDYNDSFILFTEAKNLYLYQSNKIEYLAALPLLSDINNIAIYSYKHYVAIVEDKSVNGYVIDIEKKSIAKILNREDYYAGHTPFSIGFIEKNNRIQLIHATEWNRLDITDLATDRLLTVRDIDESNDIDYFYGRLLIAPDQRHFLSDGWVWHPLGKINCYNVNEFMTHFDRACFIPDFYCDDWGLPVCWLDQNRFAVYLLNNDDEKQSYSIAISDIRTRKTFKRQHWQSQQDKDENKPVSYYSFEQTVGFESITHPLLHQVYINKQRDSGGEYDVIRGKLVFDKSTNCLICLGINGLCAIDLTEKLIADRPELMNMDCCLSQRKLYRLDRHKQIIEWLPFDDLF